MVAGWHPTGATLAEGRSGTLSCNPALQLSGIKPARSDQARYDKYDRVSEGSTKDCPTDFPSGIVFGSAPMRSGGFFASSPRRSVAQWVSRRGARSWLEPMLEGEGSSPVRNVGFSYLIIYRLAGRLSGVFFGY